VGRFEAEFFDPASWKPEYPNPAFDNMRPDDAFWAAHLVAKFSPEAIRAVVAKARYSEPGAADYIAETLIKRRDKFLRTWLTGVNPVVNPALATSGMLTFVNAAVAAGVASPPASYVLTWSRYDNAADADVDPGEELRVREPRATAPPALLESAAFVSVTIQSVHSDHSKWAMPVRIRFRRSAGGWEAVGLDRAVSMPSSAAQ